MKEKYRFSIIIATLNCGPFIEKCLESLICQTFQNFEIIVIDGGSVDDTVASIKKYEPYISYWESRKDRGIYHAFNKAIKKASGEWLYFIGSDDFLWSKRTLSDVNKYISNTKQIYRYVYGRVNHIDPNGTRIKTTGKEWNRTHKTFFEIPIDHQAGFHHISLFRQYGLYSEDFSILSDYDFQMKTIYRHHENCLFIPVTIAGHLYGGISTQIKNRFLVYKEKERIKNAYNIKQSTLNKLFCTFRIFVWVCLLHIFGEKNTEKLQKKLTRILN